MSTKKTEQKPMTFEEAAARLEEIVRALESGTLPLEESLSLYEEGVRLVRDCSRELNEAEQKVKVLQKTAEGEIHPVDFAAPDAE
ncbi:MAG: exodeoxyribonuclease VII small subunit [Clostridia bacterium]|nr:exodeoxyribonuclease VII small subunit [Clostridia bacterium]